MVMPNKKALECPNCRLVDSVQKVSGIVKSGTSETSLKGNGQAVSYSFGDDGLAVGAGRFKASGSQITVLSKQLARPNLQPRSKSGVLGCLFPISVIITIISMLVLFSGENIGSTLLTLVVFAFITIFLFIPFNQERIRYEDYLEDFQAATDSALERWNDLYYCHRCDGIFVPGEALGHSETAEKGQF